MDSAPRDGTVVEIKNSYGLLPTYGLFKWAEHWAGEPNWRSAQDPNSGIMEGIEHKLSWRPADGDVESYRDYNPTMEDWRRAVMRF